MPEHEKQLVVFPGTFDPVTNGHVDVIRRGAALFDELVVAVGDNPAKQAMLTRQERVAILRRIAEDLPNVRVEGYRGLTVDLVRRLGARAILRGVRNGADLQPELQMAQTNRIAADVETLFIMTSAEHAFTSSSLIKQIASMGGDVSGLVPPEAVGPVLARFGRTEAGGEGPSEEEQ